jgi:hypothetical protein
MYRCCYVLSDANKRYSTQLEDCECVEGDRTDLITQIKRNENFCRDQQAVDYDYFVDSLEEYSVIYIQNNSDNNILGACSVDLNASINIYSICVPDHGIKGIGKLLLDNVKDIGGLIEAECIFLSTKSSVVGFYKKNGFIIDGYDEDPIYGTTYNMIYNVEKTLKTPTSSQKRKSSSQKRKSSSQKRKSSSQKRKSSSQKRKSSSQKRKSSSQKRKSSSQRKNNQHKITKKRK